MPPNFSSELQQERKLESPVPEERVTPDSKTLSQEFHNLLEGFTELEREPMAEDSFSSEENKHDNETSL